MKKINLAEKFLDEKLMRNVSVLSVLCSLVSIIILTVFHVLNPLTIFETIVKVVITLLTLWAFSRFHWDVAQGLMGALLFALLYQESFLVLGKLWGETSDFDTFLIMGVQGSLYLAAQGMSFLMTLIIIINHFVIDYSRIGNYGNVIFNQISILFKIFLYISLMVINIFLNEPIYIQVSSGLGFLADLCIVIVVICIETQLDNFKSIKYELAQAKKEREKA